MFAAFLLQICIFYVFSLVFPLKMNNFAVDFLVVHTLLNQYILWLNNWK